MSLAEVPLPAGHVRVTGRWRTYGKGSSCPGKHRVQDGLPSHRAGAHIGQRSVVDLLKSSYPKEYTNIIKFGALTNVELGSEMRMRKCGLFGKGRHVQSANRSDRWVGCVVGIILFAVVAVTFTIPTMSVPQKNTRIVERKTVDFEELGELAYGAYAQRLGMEAVKFDELPAQHKDAWRAVADVIVRVMHQRRKEG